MIETAFCLFGFVSMVTLAGLCCSRYFLRVIIRLLTARRADGDALAALFEELKVQEGGIEKLNSMDAASVVSAIQASVASYIYHRWLLDLGKRLEERAVTPKHAVKLERDVKQHVKNLVKINLKGKDVLKVDWRGGEGRQFTQQIYEEAYELLGVSKCPHRRNPEKEWWLA